jgi:nitroimidazol reductase NimA-like FMN-containing flavoprotein (pyridoxamine 5'-phosphate oxidase superfamily)
MVGTTQERRVDSVAGDPVLEDLSREECLSLLADHSLGRVAGVVDGRPFVFPVNYAVHADSVVFRTSQGTKLAGAGFGRVAFEIDGMDESHQTGWSVIVQGVGTEITDALDGQSELLRRLELQPWVPGDRSHWVSIRAESITGRRIRRQ